MNIDMILKKVEEKTSKEAGKIAKVVYKSTFEFDEITLTITREGEQDFDETDLGHPYKVNIKSLQRKLTDE